METIFKRLAQVLLILIILLLSYKMIIIVEQGVKSIACRAIWGAFAVASICLISQTFKDEGEEN